MPKPVVTLLATGLLLAVMFMILASGRASGRADIQNYLKGPNLFYPRFHDLNGSATKQVIDVLGWNRTRLAGNVGIGNGSVRTFDQTHTYDVEYPVNEFMCGDVSTQPWIPGLKTEPAPVEAAAEETEIGSAAGHEAGAEALAGADEAGPEASGNADQSAIRYATTNDTGTAGDQTGNRTGASAFNVSAPKAPSKAQIAAANENPIYAADHPIQYLSPVKDLLYEHPLSTSGTAYCALLGFPAPTGDLVNVGMKCTGYGY